MAEAPVPAHPTSARSSASGAGQGTDGRMLLALAICAGASWLGGTLCRRLLRQPELIGQLAAGILLGPSVFGRLAPDAQQWLFASDLVHQIDVLAQLGVVLFVFLLAHDLAGHNVRGLGVAAGAVSAVSAVLPALLGALLAWWLYPEYAPPGASFPAFAGLIGVVFGVTAVPVLGAILHDLRFADRPVGILALGSAVVTDALCWAAMAAIAAMQAESLASSFLMVAGAAVFIAAAAATARWSRAAAPDNAGLAITVIVVLLGASCTAFLGLHPILGAFVIGVLGVTGRAAQSSTADRLRDLTRVLLLPLFFVTVGLRLDIAGLIDPGMAGLLAVAFLIACAGKIAGATTAGRLLGLRWPDALQLGALLNCRGVTDLVVIELGYRLGLLTLPLYAILVIVAVLTTTMTAPLMHLLTRSKSSDVLVAH
ncbi:cation:proton antiporter [Actinoplanes sp. URMC 104]|uniref:cation:proton antiporter n=1 Tax=Actinoplanes sp. URMC 104 TaxID=3423409 RepID=UPI003F1A6AF3